MENIRKIQKSSKRLRVICIALLIITPVLIGLYWGFINILPSNVALDYFPMMYIRGDLSATTRMLAFLVSMLKASVVMFALYVLARLFKFYESLEIFSKNTTACYRKLGYAFLIWFVVGFIYEALMSIVLTIDRPPGKRLVGIDPEPVDLAALIVGYIIVVISRVMSEGHKLDHDQKLTI